MARTKNLQSQMRDVALEYMRKVADLLGRDLRDCHWVGTDDHERGIYTICDMGNITFLTLDQMQVIIDRLPEWLARYGSREAVAQEIDDWMEWSIQEENLLDGHPRINLEHWLMGCPREPKTDTTTDDEIQQHRYILSVLGTVRGSYGGGITIGQAVIAIRGRLVELEAYKHFRKMMEDEQ